MSFGRKMCFMTFITKCFPRTVRETLDEISHSIPEETKQILKEIGVSQWDDEAGGFKLGKYFIPFNADIVSTITGLRNKGIAAHITMKTEIAFLESTNAVPVQHPNLFSCMLRWSPTLFWYHTKSEKLIEDIAGVDPTEEYGLGYDDCVEQSREFDKPQDNVTTDILAKPVDQNDNSTAAMPLRLSSVEKLLYALNSQVVQMDTQLDSCCNILFEL
ncbi:hypothetical protein AXF42_Ash008097 [Apostasia shenzhenica]|uniref:Uncharacterized protein n=1 Tax=Apostasia shenzhenica TaxID=1088818 RepID=A0A2I0A8K8_9ASPA|nr:hypothetical protein AXF42_Ash008097 [Apostasia shenzhenica]